MKWRTCVRKAPFTSGALVGKTIRLRGLPGRRSQESVVKSHRPCVPWLPIKKCMWIQLNKDVWMWSVLCKTFWLLQRHPEAKRGSGGHELGQQAHITTKYGGGKGADETRAYTKTHNFVFSSLTAFHSLFLPAMSAFVSPNPLDLFLLPVCFLHSWKTEHLTYLEDKATINRWHI